MWTRIRCTFTGQQWDSESGLHYFRARHYSTQFGRFMSPDPTGIFLGNLNDPQSLNLYAYVRNNPLAFVDPTGLMLCFCSDSGGGGWLFDPFDWWFGAWNSGSGGWGGPVGELPGGGGGGSQSPKGNSSGTNPPPPPPPPPEIQNPKPPNNSATPPACQAKILNATNNRFGTDYTNANVNSTFNFSTGAPPGQGTLNLNVFGSTAGVSPGYYPVHWWTYAIGYGPTLHAVSGPGGNGGLDSTQTLQFGPNQATFHIDSGFPYNPIGAFFHWLLNMTKAGGYPQC